MRHGGLVRRWWAFSCLLSIVAAWLSVLTAPAEADTQPDPGIPATVSADGLPTWQVNGVVWSQVMVGNIVYATGKFTKARPPGTAAGSPAEIDAGNIFAYDIRTGNPLAGFNHSLNAQGMVVGRSPDGSRIYVGGDFTAVDGVARGHVAAFDASTGRLVTGFAPSVGGQVRALAASNSTVYFGGAFMAVNGQPRTRLGAVSDATGAVTAWAPKADDNTVWSMVLAPDGTRVVVGGAFTTLNGTPAVGMGSLSVETGQQLPWAANQTIKVSGASGAVTSLHTDGTQIYGSGYSFDVKASNFEGTFAADPDTGTIAWLNDCHGDTYDTLPVGEVLYSVGHAHDCRSIAEMPETAPRTWHRAMATTTYPTTVNTGPDSYGWNYAGFKASKPIHWWPTLTAGSFTGQSQAAWSLTGNSDYISLGGEFPSINSVAQQGLVRFARPGLAPNKRGIQNPVWTTAATSPSSGTVALSWAAVWDMDNAKLRYDVLQDGSTQPIFTVRQASSFYRLPSMGHLVKGLAPGSTHSYRIKVTDPFNNTATSPAVSVTVSSASLSSYAGDVLADGATSYWRLGEASGGTVQDLAGTDTATAGAGVTRGAAGAVGGDSDTASTFSGAGTGFVATNNATTAPDSFTVEAWVNTTSVRGGKIVGYGDNSNGNSTNSDRHLYMDNAGHVLFGVNNSALSTLQSPAVYNNGQWHHLVASLGAGGAVLYVDGVPVARDQSITTALPYTGYWRIGGDDLTGWARKPSSAFLAGSIDEVAVYDKALPVAAVQRHYLDSGRTLPLKGRPTDAYGAAVYDSEPELYWRLGEASGTTAQDTSPWLSDGLYSGGVTFGQPGAPGGTSDTAVQFDGVGGSVALNAATSSPSRYTEELWFKTTTVRGGRLIGFSTARLGTSGGYDRVLSMQNSGRLQFGVFTDQLTTVVSPSSYNDGRWHHAAVSQGPGGIRLYADGALVGTSDVTGAKSFRGYWRAGGDQVWGGSTSRYLAGTLDEVAVYPQVLSGADIRSHFLVGGGTPANERPTASFTSDAGDLVASFDASASSDPDGTVASYDWDFGDGATSTGEAAQHTYAADGTFQVTLTVTDDKGATASVTQPVTVTAPAPENQSPTASFTSEVSGGNVSFDGSASSDPDGTVDSYAWDFGDGVTGDGRTAAHLYAADGTYQVTLKVTDDKGATASVTQPVTVKTPGPPPQNQTPRASFTTEVSGQVASFDASASSDPDGTVDSYAWDYGDGGTDTGRLSQHTYAVGGTYTVTLRVTDDKGATDAVTQPVTVTAPAEPVLIASDDFTRTLTGGWGTSDLGGPWALTGSASSASVNGAAGVVTMARASVGSRLNLGSLVSDDVDLRTSLSLDKLPVGGTTGMTESVIVRGNSSGDYRAKAQISPNGVLKAALYRLDAAGAQTVLAPLVSVAGVSYKDGDVLSIRAQAVGTSPTTLRAKVWPQGSPEPDAWTVSAQDSTAGLQTGGSVGLMSYLNAGVTNTPIQARHDDLRVQAASTLR
jgi:trimeric autotransporter adhesin